MTDEELADITREKSLWDVHRDVTRKIRSRPLYKWIVGGTFVALVLAGIFSQAPARTLGDEVREWSAKGFAFSVGVIGILIAGFAIFSTIAGTDIVRPLALHKEEKSGLSYLKYTAGCFMLVFIPFLAFIAMHLLVMLLGWRDGPVTQLVTALSSLLGVDVGRGGAVLAMGGVGAFLVHLAIVLQAFVFNVYATFMFMARMRIEAKPPAPAARGQATASADLAEAALIPPKRRVAPPPPQGVDGAVPQSEAPPAAAEGDEAEDDVPANPRRAV